MNLLFVSLAFPPKNDPECIQAGRYFRYLCKDKGWNIDVLTSSSPTLFMPVDECLRRYDTGYRQKVEIPLFESRILNFALRRSGLGGILFPDSKMTFHWQWRKAADHLAVKPDLIYSRSNPMSSAVMAQKLKRHFNVPWVMHMSDPWAISPLEDQHAKGKVRMLEMESALLSGADKVTFTSRQQRDFYTTCYPQFSSRFMVLPNVYDPEEIREVPWIGGDKLRIVYTGGMTGMRNVFFLEDVLEKALLTCPDLAREVEFIFVGDMDRSSRNFFNKGQSVLRHDGMKSHAECLELCETAHLLMVVDNPTSPDMAIFFPSKLLDYFLVKRKIWAVTPEGSVTRDVLKGSNHIAFRHDEITRMSEFLLDSIRQHKRGESSAFCSVSIPEAFSAEMNAETLSLLLKQTIS